MARIIRDLGLRTKILLCASLIQIAILITGAVIYREIVQSQQRSAALLRTTRIINTTEALQAQLSAMDVGARGYMLGGNEVFLDPYAHAYAEASQLSAQLRDQLQDNPEQLALLDEVQQQLERWRNDYLGPGIDLRGRLQPADQAGLMAIVQRERAAKRAFDRLQVRVNAFRSVELDRVDQRDAEARQAAGSLRITLVICMVLLVVGSIGTFWLLASSIARRIERVTAAATQMAGGDLEARCALPASRDEIGQMAQTFNTMAAALKQHADSLQVQYRAAEEARRDAERARTQVQAQLDTIAQQQGVIREMSVPVLPLDSTTLVMPLVGALDSERLLLVQSQALQALEHSRARQLILDVTGVPVVDTLIARGLLQVTQMAELLGARVLVVGIRPEVAQALVALDLSWSHFQTYSTLQQGIAHTLGQAARRSARQPSQPNGTHGSN